jgi:alkylation response protein AidB-like acyl-CoA dehydrogenase
LTAVACGERTAAVVVPFGGPGAGGGVVDALHADVLLVPADDGLYAVDGASGVSRTPVVSLDLTRPLADVTVDAAGGRRIGSADAVTAALTAGAAILASEQLGVAEWCLTTTVEYVKQRHQFGRPVGSYQALKHRLADLWVDVTQARAAARYAAGCLTDGDPDLPVAVAVAQAHCSAVAVRAAEECVQMHGGIGFTWEHPAHLYLKRAKSQSLALGTADRHRAALAELVDLTL